MHFSVRGYLSDSVSVNTILADRSIDIGNANLFTDAEFHHDVNVSGSNSINNLCLQWRIQFSQAPGETLTLGTNLQVQADCNGLAGIRSTIAGSPTSISMASGNVVVDFVSLNSIAAGGGATFTANNSVDGGNNTGWTINSPAPRTVYWVGGSGNWSDPAHWSLVDRRRIRRLCSSGYRSGDLRWQFRSCQRNTDARRHQRQRSRHRLLRGRERYHRQRYDHQRHRRPCTGTGDELERCHHEPAAGSFRHRSDE